MQIEIKQTPEKAEIPALHVNEAQDEIKQPPGATSSSDHEPLTNTAIWIWKAGSSLIINEQGDVPAWGGLFRGMCYLNELSWHLALNGKRLPLVQLATHRNSDGHEYQIDYGHEAHLEGPRDAHSLVIQKNIQFATGEKLISTFRVTNYDQQSYTLEVRLTTACPDFKDIMEIRGHPRKRGTRGTISSHYHDRGACWRYEGLDKVARKTQLNLHPAPSLRGNCWSWTYSLAPGETQEFVAQVDIDDGSLQHAHKHHYLPTEHWSELFAQVDTSDWRLNRLLKQGQQDSLSLLFFAELPDGAPVLYPAAGVPWYFTPFARDAIIWGLQMLDVFPHIARNILSLLAAYQGGFLDLEIYHKRAPGAIPNGAQPGKIPHELRFGEMARLGLHHYALNYQSLDSTPLFCWLMGQYVQRTGDKAFLAEYWPHLEAATRWMITYGDLDGDSFLEHERGAAGLTVQSWKDSFNSMCHQDGSLAAGNLAAIEVQGFAFAALRESSKLAAMLGKSELALNWEVRAERLQKAFEQAFWDEESQYWVLALDGNGAEQKQACRVISSNPGQALLTGIIPTEKLEKAAQRLMQPDMFSGWGIRTLAASEKSYHPLSYHNGSVWPHDTGLIAAALARNDYKVEAAKILNGLVGVAEYYDWRLPEVLGGFPRVSHYGPTLYPTSCSPQLWAAGVPFLILTSLLGLEINGLENRVIVRKPYLPDWLDWTELRGLRVGNAAPFTLRFERASDAIKIRITGQGTLPELQVSYE
jgi:glycogen debranching enzyme